MAVSGASETRPAHAIHPPDVLAVDGCRVRIPGASGGRVNQRRLPRGRNARDRHPRDGGDRGARKRKPPYSTNFPCWRESLMWGNRTGVRCYPSPACLIDRPTRTGGDPRLHLSPAGVAGEFRSCCQTECGGPRRWWITQRNQEGSRVTSGGCGATVRRGASNTARMGSKAPDTATQYQHGLPPSPSWTWKAPRSSNAANAAIPQVRSIFCCLWCIRIMVPNRY